MKRKAFHAVEQDGGLWQVFEFSADESHSVTLGWVWNEGYMPDERNGKPYRACEHWDSCVPVGIIGEAKTWMGAIGLLFKHKKAEADRLAREDELSGFNAKVDAFESLKKVATVIVEHSKHHDTIWQDDWSGLVGMAEKALAMVVNYNLRS